MSILVCRIQRAWLPISLMILVAITYLSLTPLPELPDLPGSDKLHHLIAYAALIFPAIWAGKPVWLGLVYLLWSGLIELIQPMVNRYGQWEDFLANGIGLLIGGALAMLLRQWVPKPE